MHWPTGLQLVLPPLSDIALAAAALSCRLCACRASLEVPLGRRTGATGGRLIRSVAGALFGRRLCAARAPLGRRSSTTGVAAAVEVAAAQIVAAARRVL